MNARYAGKTVVVTGGGTGARPRDGASRSRARARDVCVIGRRQRKTRRDGARRSKRNGGKAFAFSADVRDAARVEAVMKEIVERAGRIDVLVNNAAGQLRCARRKSSRPTVSRASSTSCCSVRSTARVSPSTRCARRKGSIVNIVAAYAWSGEPGAVHSASAKAGVLAMTRTLAAEWGRFGIRANAIAPGPIHTEGTDANLWSVGERRGRGAKIDAARTARRARPTFRARRLWLCSDEARGSAARRLRSTARSGCTAVRSTSAEALRFRRAAPG